MRKSLVNGIPKVNFLQSKKRHLMIGMGIGAIVFVDIFLWQMFRTLHGPFLAMLEQSAQAGSEQVPLTQEEVLVAMRAKDTDQDGLSDYDETYTYNTSAYLDDTDSDGSKDGEEVKNGTDPNCPDGKDCGLKTPESQQGKERTEVATEFDKDAAQSLRAALEQTGMPKAQLDTLSDAELMKLYSEAVSSMSANGENVKSGKADLTPDQLLYFEQLGPNEIREMLKKAGVDESLIKTIPDQRLKDLYLETLGGMK